MMECDQLAVVIEAGLEIMRGQRIKASVMNVVLARPHHLDRLFHRIRQHHRVIDEFLVTVAAPAEAAAHQHVVINDLVLRNAERVAATVTAIGLDCTPHHTSQASPSGETAATAFSGSICA